MKHRTIPPGMTVRQQADWLGAREARGAQPLGVVRVSRGEMPSVDYSIVVLLDEEPYACVVAKGSAVYVKGFGRHPGAEKP